MVAGNWKMNGLRADGVALSKAVAGSHVIGSADCDVVVCPPATLLTEVRAILAEHDDRVALGAQDCATAESGAYTGDVSAPMLADAGCRYVIVGHSERRAGHGETSTWVHVKAEAALSAGLVPIVCVGETEAERDDGRALEVVVGQLKISLPSRPGPSLVVAYEPVWAIGTGRTPTEDEIAEVHAQIRASLAGMEGIEADAVRLLYGGSVKPSNAQAIAAIENVDGALVGGASLNAEDFAAICQSWSEAV
jgi:triosephosphate isomerase